MWFSLVCLAEACLCPYDSTQRCLCCLSGGLPQAWEGHNVIVTALAREVQQSQLYNQFWKDIYSGWLWKFCFPSNWIGRHMWLMSAILPNCLRRAPTGSILIVPTRGVEGAFLIQMNSEIQTIMSAARQPSAAPNPEWRCRDVLWGHLRANTTSNKHTHDSHFWILFSRRCQMESFEGRHRRWLGVRCPLLPVSSSAPCLFVWQKYCVLHCWPHSLWVLWDWKGRKNVLFSFIPGFSQSVQETW